MAIDMNQFTKLALEYLARFEKVEIPQGTESLYERGESKTNGILYSTKPIILSHDPLDGCRDDDKLIVGVMYPLTPKFEFIISSMTSSHPQPFMESPDMPQPSKHGLLQYQGCEGEQILTADFDLSTGKRTITEQIQYGIKDKIDFRDCKWESASSIAKKTLGQPETIEDSILGFISTIHAKRHYNTTL